MKNEAHGPLEIFFLNLFEVLYQILTMACVSVNLWFKFNTCNCESLFILHLSYLKKLIIDKVIGLKTLDLRAETW